jgi:hypothetical protein
MNTQLVSAPEEPDGYLIEPSTYRNLVAVMHRLYQGGLTGDGIRDLANIMHVNLDKSHVYPVTDMGEIAEPVAAQEKVLTREKNPS